MTNLGIKIDGRPAEDLLGLAPLAESVGFDELWVCEDLGLAGGLAQVTAALARTERLTVGLGIVPAAVRNPAYLAMEFASVARMFPGRFHAGIGHGVPSWLSQVGQRPASLMACLDEVADSVRGLLEGRPVTATGQHVSLNDVELTHPPIMVPRLSLGVRGPKGIDLCSRLGVGPILAEGSTPDYVASVRRALGPDARITVFAWANLVPGAAESAREQLRPIVRRALTDPDLASQLGDLFGSDDELRGVDELAVAGDRERCATAIRGLARSGADCVVLQPIRGREEEQIRLFGELLIPALRVSA